MNDPQVDWLRRELPRLVREGVLDEPTAARLAAHYDAREPAPRTTGWMIAALGTLGALLVGGGIVLLIAHNWDAFGRPLRVGLSLGQLLLAQALAAYVLLKRRDATGWREAAGGLLAVAVAGSIALISQTYHIPGELRDYLLVCALLVAAVPYLLDAQLPAAMFYGALLVRGFSDGWGVDGLDLALAAIGVPFLVKLARTGRECRLLVALVAVLAIPLGPAELEHVGGGLWPLWVSAVLALWHALGTTGDEPWRQPLRIVARIGLPILLFVLTFTDVWEHLGRDVTWGAPVTLAVIALVVAAGVAANWIARGAALDLRLAAAALVPVAVGVLQQGAALAAVTVNLYVVALGLAFLARGFRELRLGLVNYGLFLLAGLAILRFVDSDLSFIVRGIGFIVVGLMFLGTNVLVARRREVTR